MQIVRILIIAGGFLAVAVSISANADNAATNKVEAPKVAQDEFFGWPDDLRPIEGNPEATDEHFFDEVLDNAKYGEREV